FPQAPHDLDVPRQPTNTRRNGNDEATGHLGGSPGRSTMCVVRRIVRRLSVSWSHNRTRVTDAVSQTDRDDGGAAMNRGEVMKPILRWAVAAAMTLAPVATQVRAAEILWPSHQWGEPNNAAVMLELKKRFEQENPGHTVSNVVVPQATFFDKQFADV